MGVPKFAAWLTRKYPSMVQKQAPSRSFGLYLDMNGIIHPCTHGDDDSKKGSPPPKKKHYKKKPAADGEGGEGDAGSAAGSGDDAGSQVSDQDDDASGAAASKVKEVVHPLSLDWSAVLPHLKPKFSSWTAPLEELPPIAANENDYIEYDTLAKVSQVCLAVNFLVMAARPQKMLYLAMDGVAPRAKMVQQRSRRYMAAAEKHGGSIAIGGSEESSTGGQDGGEGSESEDAELRNLKESAGGLYNTNNATTTTTGADAIAAVPEAVVTPEFDSNCISPGTLFMTRCSENLEKHIRYMLEVAETYEVLVKELGSDGDVNLIEAPQGVPQALWIAAPFWTGLTVVLSDTNTPGEGEHKIVDFIRAQQASIEREQQQLLIAECAKGGVKEQLLLPHTPPPPRLQTSPPCHVIMAKDADLILLCLGLHLPNVVIMRDEFRLGAFSVESGWPVVSKREIVPEELFYAALKRHEAQQVALVKSSEGTAGNVKDFSPVTTKIKKSRPMFDYYNINTLGRLIVSEVYALTKRAHPTLRNSIDFDDTCRGALEKLVEIEKRALMPLSGANADAVKRPKKSSGGRSNTGGSGGDERMAVLIDAAIQCFQTASTVYSAKPGEAPTPTDPSKPNPITFDTVRFAAIRRRPMSEEEARELANVAMLIASDQAAIDPRDGLVKRKLQRGGWGTVLSNPCAVPTHNKAIINDYITMATLLGNDFMPRLPSGFCGDFAMDNLVEAYVHCVLPYGYLTDVSALPQAAASAETAAVSTTEDGSTTTTTTTTTPATPAVDPMAAYMHRSKDPAEIRLDQLYRLLEGYAKVEISQLRQQCFNTGKYGDSATRRDGAAVVSIEELNRVQQDRVLFDPVVDGIWWTPYYETTSIVGSTSRYNMIECYKNHNLFEPKALKGSSNATPVTANPTSPSAPAANKEVRKVIDHACHWYLDGIQFVFQYYVTNSTLPANINLETTTSAADNEKTSEWQQKAAGRYWAWCFPYHHAPFAIDIVAYLRTLLQLDVDGIPAADAPTYLSDLFAGRGARTLDVAAKEDDLTDSTVIIPTPFTQLLAILPPTSASLLPAPLAQLMLKDVTNGHQGTSVALTGATSKHGVASSLSCTFPARWGIDYTVADGGKEHLATVLLPFADVDFLASCVAGVFCKGTSESTLPLIADDRIRNVNKMYTQVYEAVRKPTATSDDAADAVVGVVSPTFGSYVNHVSSWPALNDTGFSVAKFDYPELTARAGASPSGAVSAALVRRDYAYIWDACPSPLELQEIAVVDYATSACKVHTDELLGSAPWVNNKRRKYNNFRRGGGPIRDAAGGFFAGGVYGFGTDFAIKSKERFTLIRTAIDALLRCPFNACTKASAPSRCSPVGNASSSPLGLAPFQEQVGLKPIISSTADMWALASRRLGVTTPNVPFAMSTGSGCDPLGLLNANKVEVPIPNASMLQPASLSLGDVWVYVVALMSIVSAFLALVGGGGGIATIGGDWGLFGLLIPASVQAAVDVLLVGFFTAVTGLAFMLLFTGSGNNIPVKESLIRRNATNHRIFAPRVDWVCAGAPSSLVAVRVDQVGSYLPISQVNAPNKIAPTSSWVLPAATLSTTTTGAPKSMIEKIKSQLIPNKPSAHIGGCLATNYGRNETCFVCGAPCEEADGGAWAMLSSKMKPDRDHLNTNHGTSLEEVFLCLPSLHAASELNEGSNGMDNEAAMAMLKKAGVVASTSAATTTTTPIASSAATAAPVAVADEEDVDMM